MLIDKIRQLISDIETGLVTLSPLDHPHYVYAGDVYYKASNGWGVTVFNDCDSWDYFDRFESPDGEVLDYDDMPDDIRDYHPSDEVARDRYWFGTPDQSQRRTSV